MFPQRWSYFRYVCCTRGNHVYFFVVFRVLVGVFWWRDWPCSEVSRPPQPQPPRQLKWHPIKARGCLFFGHPIHRIEQSRLWTSESHNYPSPRLPCTLTVLHIGRTDQEDDGGWVIRVDDALGRTDRSGTQVARDRELINGQHFGVRVAPRPSIFSTRHRGARCRSLHT